MYNHDQISLGYSFTAQNPTCSCNGACPYWEELKYPGLLKYAAIRKAMEDHNERMHAELIGSVFDGR